MPVSINDYQNNKYTVQFNLNNNVTNFLGSLKFFLEGLIIYTLFHKNMLGGLFPSKSSISIMST